MKIRRKLNVIKFLGPHEYDEIPKYQHVIGSLDYTMCGYATDEYETETKIGRLTCPKCIDELNRYMDYYEFPKCAEKDKQLAEQENECKLAEEDLTKKHREIQSLEEMVKEKNRDITKQDKKIGSLNAEIVFLGMEIEKLKKRISGLIRDVGSWVESKDYWEGKCKDLRTKFIGEVNDFRKELMGKWEEIGNRCKEGHVHVSYANIDNQLQRFMQRLRDDLENDTP